MKVPKIQNAKFKMVPGTKWCQAHLKKNKKK